MNNNLIGSVVLLLMVCSPIQGLFASGGREPLSHVTMGDIKFPIVAETDELTIVKMGERYTATKRIGSDGRASEYESCGIFEAQRDLLKKPLDAAAIYEKCLETIPEDHGLLRALGISYMVARNFNKSVSSFERAVQQTPEDGVLHEQLADAYAMRGQMDEAEKHYGFARKYMRRSESVRLSKKLDRIKGFGFDNVVASYLLDYNGIQIRNGLVAALSYTDPIRSQDLDGDREVYYLSEADDEKDAVIDLNRLYKDLFAMKALNQMIKEDREAAQAEESEEKASIDQLKNEIEKTDDETVLREELDDAQRALINRLVKREVSYILAREEVQNEVDAQIRIRRCRCEKSGIFADHCQYFFTMQRLPMFGRGDKLLACVIL